jgi:hypothetical protein
MPTTLIVEDGTVVANANAFVALATCDTYHSLRGNSAWTGTDAAKEAAIVKATFYLDRLNWKGLKTGVNNPLAWPRYGDSLQGWNRMVMPASPFIGIVDEDGYDVGTATVPVKVQYACCEMALRFLNSAVPEPDLDRGGKIKSQTIDVISITYESGAPTAPVYTVIQRLLRGLLRADTTSTIQLGM